jgi:alpha-N-arabinofuranosidase
VCVLASGVSAVAQVEKPVTLAVDMSQAKAKVSPTLYGLMTEEINYSYDGGLYGELVRNRALQDRSNRPEHWSLYEGGTSDAVMKIDATTGPSEALRSSLELAVNSVGAKQTVGVENEGYWGFPVRPRTTYTGSFYAKTSGDVGPVTVSLLNDQTGVAAASAVVSGVGTEWKKYEFTLKTGAVAVSSNNRLRLAVGQAGTVWLSMVSLFPPTYMNRENGNRIDLMEKMAAMHPAFLRFPGGNYLEGDHINERFEWKKTIGPLVDRPTHISPWRYHSSDGMGLLEFLEWCEELKMQPVLAVYAGYSMRQEFVKPGSALDPYVQDAMDEIEYVTGGTDTTWGAVRAKDGHPAPFPLNYVEIGNEDFFDKSGSYDGRYEQFYKAIKAKYPALQLIATTPVKSMKPDVVDDHYYKTAREFYADVHHYDAVDRNGPKIFVGEWATREGSPTPNFGAALGDAAWMTGMEKNSDLVVMASYAPLLVNVNPGGMQWETDLIGYDTLHSYGSPSYYAQVLFSNHLGDEILSANAEGETARFFYSVTRSSATGKVYLKVVNATSEARPVTIKLDGASRVAATGKVFTLSAKTTAATNTIERPTAIVPVDGTISNAASQFVHTVPGYSIQVIELQTK